MITRARLIITAHFLNAMVQRMIWPARNPDLNHLEHLWDHLGRTVRPRVNDVTTLLDLQLVEEYGAISQPCIRR